MGGDDTVDELQSLHGMSQRERPLAFRWCLMLKDGAISGGRTVEAKWCERRRRGATQERIS